MRDDEGMSEHQLAALAGTWAGRGDGEYPTIDDFSYTEELVIEPVPGQPLAHWQSRTKDEATGEPKHAESGFLRAAGTAPSGGTSQGEASKDVARNAGIAVELVVAHTFGIVEISTGSFDGATLYLTGGPLHSSPTAKHVEQVERRYHVAAGRLDYTFAMAAVGVDMTHHLEAELHRDR